MADRGEEVVLIKTNYERNTVYMFTWRCLWFLQMICRPRRFKAIAIELAIFNVELISSRVVHSIVCMWKLGLGSV